MLPAGFTSWQHGLITSVIEMKSSVNELKSLVIELSAAAQNSYDIVFCSVLFQ